MHPGHRRLIRLHGDHSRELPIRNIYIQLKTSRFQHSAVRQARLLLSRGRSSYEDADRISCIVIIYIFMLIHTCCEY